MWQSVIKVVGSGLVSQAGILSAVIVLAVFC